MDNEEAFTNIKLQLYTIYGMVSVKFIMNVVLGGCVVLTHAVK